ncbi:MAG: hypothetical protein WCJ35_24270 [Planctomycetota bacterium]
MAVDLQAVKDGLEARSLLIAARIAANEDVPDADVETCLLALGSRFDGELAKAQKRLRIATLQAEMAPMKEVLELACSATEAAYRAKDATIERHKTELNDADRAYRDAWLVSNGKQAALNRVETEVMKLQREVA